MDKTTSFICLFNSIENKRRKKKRMWKERIQRPRFRGGTLSFFLFPHFFFFSLFFLSVKMKERDRKNVLTDDAPSVKELLMYNKNCNTLKHGKKTVFVEREEKVPNLTPLQRLCWVNVEIERRGWTDVDHFCWMKKSSNVFESKIW